MKQLILLILMNLGLGHVLFSQVFVVHQKNITTRIHADAAWIRGNSGLDLIVTGELAQQDMKVVTTYYFKDRNQVYKAQPKGLPDLKRASIAVGDLNKNGLADVFLSGVDSQGRFLAGIYFQQTNGNFVLSPVQVPALVDGHTEIADFDKDNDLDILLTGMDASGRSRTVILENKSGEFAIRSFDMPGVINGEARWGDANKDGFLDIFITGNWNGHPVSRLYIYKEGNYLLHPQSFPALTNSAVVWADFNNDGLNDFVLAGADVDGRPYTRLFLGNKSLYFDEQSISGFRPLKNVSMDIADFDSDGDMDLLIAGESMERPYTILYENKGKGIFEDFVAGLPWVSEGVVRFGDFDLDGDPDIFVMGIDVCYNLIGSIYKNTLNPEKVIEDSITNIFIDSPIVDLSRGPYYYFVFSSCYCDPENSGKKDYHAFVSNIHQEKHDFDLTYIFNDLLIKRFSGWGETDRGHRTSNAFINRADAEEGRKQVIGGYQDEGFIMHYINW
ncbi:MAG: VCBS repeat-containing protein [Bacteroidales bacterium]|jgi:hypothetical protein|nr:VCBS repeat-containing protein [Bacteroidales bacterium]HOI32211.1 VCBS repeat-containing protein [Bacteroidales bacterium]